MDLGPDDCFDSLWDAVMSVDGATMWQQGLQNIGLDLLLQDSGEHSKGVILVPKDDGVLGCNATVLKDEYQWPYGDCAQTALDWLVRFGRPEGSSILMYHWIPNQTLMSLTDRGGGMYDTLLEIALGATQSSLGDALIPHIVVSDGKTVSLPDEMSSQSKTLGFVNSQIVDVKELCDAGSGGVYVLDRPLSYPEGLPAVNATSLPALQRYCGDAIFSLLLSKMPTRDSVLLGMESASPFPSPLVSTFVGLVASSYPALPPLFNPMTNVTVFAPYTEDPLNILKYVGLTLSDIVNFRNVLPPMTFLYLNHFVPGRYCPDDFRTGLTLQTMAGRILERNYSLYIKQDDMDGNVLNIKMLWGDDPSKEYRATYLDQACSSTVYVLDAFLTPFSAPVKNMTEIHIPYTYISNLPKIPEQTKLLDFDAYCPKVPLSLNTGTNGSTTVVPTYSDKMNLGGLVGIIIGSFFVVVVVLCIGGLWWYRKKANTSRTYHPSVGENNDDNGTIITPKASLDSQIPSVDSDSWSEMPKTLPIMDEILLAESDVSIDVDPNSGNPILLGQGRFGRVLRGKLLGAEYVAIKCIYSDIWHQERCGATSDELHYSSAKVDSKGLIISPKLPEGSRVSSQDILHEISLLKSCHSQHIVSFMGAVFRPGEVWLVTELLPAGDLWHALGHSSIRTVSWYSGGIFIAIDILSGLRYLHNKRVIHLDLKSSNILLRPSCASDWPYQIPDGYRINFRAKISDVGLSRILPMSHEYISSTKVGGTWNWCAPEVILCSKCTPAADMFSFGVVLWEICTGEAPVRGRMRPVCVPSECPQEVADLIHWCICSQEPKDRPTASDAYEVLNSILHNRVNLTT